MKLDDDDRGGQAPALRAHRDREVEIEPRGLAYRETIDL